MFRLLKKLSGALLGIVLEPSARLTAMILNITLAPIIIPTYHAYRAYRSDGLSARIIIRTPIVMIGGILVGAVTTALSLPKLPKGVWMGLRTGWDRGTWAVVMLAKCRVQQVMILYRDLLNRDDFIQRPRVPAQVLQAITEAEFKQLFLNNAQEYSQCLTEVEKNQLAKYEDNSPHDWQLYKNLERLDSDDCPILMERPSPENAVLLVKQYEHRNAEWQMVVGVVNIFDKESLKDYFTKHAATHPLNRDLILEPSPIDGCSTRYVIHPFYDADGKTTLCQERHQLTQSLRDHLQKFPLSAQSSSSPCSLEEDLGSDETEEFSSAGTALKANPQTFFFQSAAEENAHIDEDPILGLNFSTAAQI